MTCSRAFMNVTNEAHTLTVRHEMQLLPSLGTRQDGPLETIWKQYPLSAPRQCRQGRVL